MHYLNSSFTFNLYFEEVTKFRHAKEVGQEQQGHVVLSVFYFYCFNDYLTDIGLFSKWLYQFK